LVHAIRRGDYKSRNGKEIVEGSRPNIENWLRIYLENTNKIRIDSVQQVKTHFSSRFGLKMY
jgi:hypothetical protein